MSAASHGSSGKRTCLLIVLGTTLLAVSNIVSAVDGVIEINQAAVDQGGITTGDTAGFPATLSEAGSYRLTGNLTLSDENTTGIDVSADDVSIDLNGFSIIGNTVCNETPVTGCAPTGPGNGIISHGRNTRVMNGVIRGAGNFGLSLEVNGGRAERVHAESNGSSGIVVNSSALIHGGVVRNCTSIRNGFDGIYIGSRGVAEGNNAVGNGRYGIFGGERSLVLRNALTLNASEGLSLANLSAYGENLISGNNDDDANPQVAGSGTEIATNYCGNDTTCP